MHLFILHNLIFRKCLMLGSLKTRGQIDFHTPARDSFIASCIWHNKWGPGSLEIHYDGICLKLHCLMSLPPTLKILQRPFCLIETVDILSIFQSLPQPYSIALSLIVPAIETYSVSIVRLDVWKPLLPLSTLMTRDQLPGSLCLGYGWLVCWTGSLILWHYLQCTLVRH